MRQALELALEALEANLGNWRAKTKAITAIKEALAQPDDKKCENCGEFGECCQNAQPKQEPVGQLLEEAYGRGQVMWFNKPKDESMLYTTPPQPEQEPVAFYVYKPTLPRGHLGNVSDGDLPWVYDQDPSSGYSARMLVYTTPPQRTWVGLTDEEKLVANQMWRVMDADGFIKAIEAKLKEKNA